MLTLEFNSGVTSSVIAHIEQAGGLRWLVAGEKPTTLKGNYMEFLVQNPTVTVLAALIAIDIITGFIAGIKNKELSSNVSFGGMLKKTLIAFIVVVAFLIAQILPDFPIVYWVTILFIPTEIISILENIKKAGVEYPAAFDVFAVRAKDFLEKKFIEIVSKSFEAIAESFAKGVEQKRGQAAPIDYDELASRLVKLQQQNSNSNGATQPVSTTTTTTTTTGNSKHDTNEGAISHEHKDY